MFKKSYCVSLLLGLIFNFCYLQPTIAEDITITTYYPSPYGSYNQLTVSDRLVVGDVNGDGTVNVNDMPVIPAGGSSIAVNGGIRVLSGVPNIAPPGSNSSNRGYSFNDDGDTGMFRTGGVNPSTQGDVAFVLDNNERMRISGAAATLGNVGIGTNNPVRRLHILNNGSAEYVQEDSALPANQRRFNIVTDATNGASSYFRVLNDAGTGGTNLMLFNHANGNVGIGTTNPVARLHIIAPGGVTVGPEPLRLQSNSTFFSGFDGAGTQRFAINNDPGPWLNFYGSDSGGWFNFMSVNNAGTRGVSFNSGTVTVANSHQDKLKFSGSNGSPNTVLWDNGVGLRFWNGTAGQIQGQKLSITDYAVAIHTPRTQITGFDGAGYHWIELPGHWPTQILGFKTSTRRMELNVGWQFDQLSSERYKEKIFDLNYGLSEILKIKPKRYIMKNDPKKVVCIGFIAENMNSIIPEIVSPDESGKPNSIIVGGLEPVLVNAIKEQQKQIDSLNEQVKELKAKIE